MSEPTGTTAQALGFEVDVSDHIAEAVLASDWLARRDAETAAKTLEDAAARLRKMDESWAVTLYGAFSDWLKGRAAAIRGHQNPPADTTGKDTP